MADFKQRLVVEKDELGIKVDKLDDFLNSDASLSIDPHQLTLLRLQLQVMMVYFSCLVERLTLLK